MVDFVLGEKSPKKGRFDEQLSNRLECPYIEFISGRYPDNSPYTMIDPQSVEHVKDKDVAIVYRFHSSPTEKSYADFLSHVPRVARSLKEDYGADNVRLIAPYLPLSRQDKNPLASTRDLGKDSGHRYQLDLFAAMGVDELLTYNSHAHVPTSHRGMKIRHLDAAPMIAYFLMDRIDDEIVIVSPDDRDDLAKNVAARLGVKSMHVSKERSSPTEVHHDGEIDVEGRHAVMIDDIIASGETIIGAAANIRNLKNLSVTGVHGVLTGFSANHFYSRLKRRAPSVVWNWKNSPLYTTDTIQNPRAKICVEDNLVSHLI